MEKTLIIDGKEVTFKSTGATALRYKMQFRKDFFAEILKLNKIVSLKDKKEIEPEDLEGIDFEVFYNISWSFAKTADPTIPDPLTWLDKFDEFPIIEIIPEIQDLLMSTLQSKKK